MMKRFTKLVAAVLAMTMLISVPVCATEKTLEAEVAMINNHVAEVQRQVDALTPKSAGFKDWPTLNAHRRNVMQQVLKWASDEFDNYILFLQREADLTKENVRIKQQNVNSIQELCKVNPSFAAQLAQAQAELLTAQQQLTTNQSQIDVVKQLKANQVAAIMAKAATYR